jgi:hypothetical protein
MYRLAPFLRKEEKPGYTLSYHRVAKKFLEELKVESVDYKLRK